MRISRLAAATVLSLTIAISAAGCADEAAPADGVVPSMGERPTMAGMPESIPEEAAGLLADYDLDGMNPQEIVSHLDQLDGPDRPADLVASVRPTELLVSTDGHEHAIALPANKFYLSLAPYVKKTHDCFYHSLTTCAGELGDTDLHVTILTTTGEMLVNNDVTTYANGFTGFWLPRNIEGTITVTADDKTGTVSFATTDDDPTCLTNLRLT